MADDVKITTAAKAPAAATTTAAAPAKAAAKPAAKKPAAKKPAAKKAATKKPAAKKPAAKKPAAKAAAKPAAKKPAAKKPAAKKTAAKKPAAKKVAAKKPAAAKKAAPAKTVRKKAPSLLDVKAALYKKIEKVSVKGIEAPVGLQIEVIDMSNAPMYVSIRANGQKEVELYPYGDKVGTLFATYDELMKIAKGGYNFAAAIRSGIIFYYGDAGKAMIFANLFK